MDRIIERSTKCSSLFFMKKEKVFDVSELVICVRSVEELKAQLGVWASLCPSPEIGIGIKVKMDSRQMEQLFYKIWESVGDELLNKWIESDGYELLKSKNPEV